MMSEASDRLRVVQQNYIEALENEPHDLALAGTAADVTAIQANVAAARQAYFTAAAASLTQDGAAVEAAYDAAVSAQQSVKQARAATEQIPSLLGKLTQATAAATTLLKKAVSA